MPFQGNGTFARVYRWQNDAANGIDILADRFDAEDDGFATGLSNCITRDGQSPPSASIPWGNQNLTGVNALSGVSFSFTGTGTVGGALGVTGNVTVGGTLGVTAGATFSAGAVAYTPNAGTTGGVRVAGNATSGNAILQFVDSTLANQWGYISITSGGAFALSAGLVTGTTISDGQSSPAQRLVGYRGLPFTASTTGRTLALTDVGMCIPATGAINIPTNASVAFPVGESIVGVYNNSGSNISITASGGVTLRLGGSATTGTRTLAQRGLVTLLKVGTDEWVALNGGIS